MVEVEDEGVGGVGCAAIPYKVSGETNVVSVKILMYEQRIAHRIPRGPVHRLNEDAGGRRMDMTCVNRSEAHTEAKGKMGE